MAVTVEQRDVRDGLCLGQPPEVCIDVDQIVIMTALFSSDRPGVFILEVLVK